MNKGNRVVVWRIATIIALVYVCRVLITAYLHPRMNDFNRIIVEGLLLVCTACIVALCCVGKQLYDVLRADNVMEQGFEIEVMVVENTKNWFGYTPEVVYLLSGIKVRATAVNRLQKPLPQGTLCAAKAREIDSKWVVLPEYEWESSKQIVSLTIAAVVVLVLLCGAIAVLMRRT